ncbi:DUF504 domain-containing protein [Azoarcus sp. PA01]|nr:DUF504 domain-containing protein [Azoarcus sp. PA01]
MIPIHALLARIRWASACGRGEFVIGYRDRVASAAPRIEYSPIQCETVKKQAGPLIGGPAFVDRSTTDLDTALL